MQELKEPSAELERRIEEWAIGMNLAKRPVRDWWIFEAATGWLRALIAGPPEMPINIALGDDDGETDNYDLYEWNSYCRLSQPLPASAVIAFKVPVWNPSWESAKDYLKLARRGFNAFLDTHQAERLTEYRLAPRVRPAIQYSWLVKNQILGQECPDIAAESGKEDSIKTTVSNLRTVIGLPQLRPVGRPAKKL